MTKPTPEKILEKLYPLSLKSVGRSAVKSQTTKTKIENVCRCNTNKAPIRFLMACLLAKIHRPEIDIRKPYTEIVGDDTFSGRFYDERFIEKFIHKYKLPCNPTTAYLTPAFRNLDRLLTTDLVLVGRPREVYKYTLELLDIVYRGKETPDSMLREIIRCLLIIKVEAEQRMKQLIADLKQVDDLLPLSSEETVTLLAQHLSCKNSSRLPVLIVAAAYQAVKEQVGEESKKLTAHNAADRQTGAIGDIEVTLINDEHIVTCYEMKDKRVTTVDIDIALQKLSKYRNKIDNYLFITTDGIEIEVTEYAKDLYENTGVEIAILDCLGFIRHYLHFFHRHRNKFLNIYQDMVLAETTSAVSQPLKEAFLALRRAAEADKR